jgi:XTP/dITP diphosphohydrolase
MRRIRLITGNAKKVKEYADFAASRGVDVDFLPLAISLPELQEENPEKVLTAKVAEAARHTTLPFCVDDASFWSARYPGFPGNFAKFVNATVGVDGLRRLFDEGDELTAVARVALHVFDETYFFEGRVEGSLTFKNTDAFDARMPMNSLFRVKETGKTLGESLRDPDFLSHRRRAMAAMSAFLEKSAAGIAESERECARRWDVRAENWNALTEDSTSFVNHEDGYARFDKTVERYKPLLRGAVLDVGCGTGIVTAALAANEAARVTGIDISPAMIDEATKAVPGAKFLVGTPATIVGRRFDAIVSRGIVLSFLPRLAVHDYLADLTALANDGAYLIMDFAQNPTNGNFPSSVPLGTFTHESLRPLMAELGWTLIDGDDDRTRRIGVAVFHKAAPSTVFFASGNPRKFEELASTLHGDVRQSLAFLRIDAPEIKSDDLEAIVADKLRKAYDAAHRPVLCTDGGIFIDGLGGFPGANSRQAAEKLGCAGILALMHGKTDRKAVRRNCIGRYDGADMRFKTAEVVCDLADDVRTDFPAYEFDRILVPRSGDGRTYAQMPTEERVLHTELPVLRTLIADLLAEAA